MGGLLSVGRHRGVGSVTPLPPSAPKINFVPRIYSIFPLYIPIPSFPTLYCTVNFLLRQSYCYQAFPFGKWRGAIQSQNLFKYLSLYIGITSSPSIRHFWLRLSLYTTILRRIWVFTLLYLSFDPGGFKWVNLGYAVSAEF